MQREQFEASGGAAVAIAMPGLAPHRLAPAGKIAWPCFNLPTPDLSTIDWAPDLAEDIGSRRWFRGLATMLALAACALALLPDLGSVRAPGSVPLDAEAREQFRSQAIAPLARGADAGSRMGPTALVQSLGAIPERTSVELTATLGEGDSIARMLERAGASPYDADWTSRMIGAVTPLASIEPGTRFALILGQRPAPGLARRLEHLAFRARFDLDLVVSRQNGSLTIDRHAITVDSTPLRIRGTVGEGIYRSARASGAPIDAIQSYLQTLDAHLSLDTDVQPTDTFDIVISWQRAASGETKPGTLLYAGIERDGEPRAQLLRWGSGGQFYDALTAGKARSGVVMPVVGGRMTSGFGQRRHPVLGYTRMHSGIDFAAATGSPIYAVTAGTTSFAGWHGGHGNFVRLEHGGGFATGYAHMSRIAVGPGMSVSAGQVIGYVGSTGLSTGPHLHYELYRNDTKVNPFEVAFSIRAQLEGKELAAFKARLAQLLAVKPGMQQGSIALATN